MSLRKHQKDLKPSPARQSRTVWTFGPFTVDAREGRLTREGRKTLSLDRRYLHSNDLMGDAYEQNGGLRRALLHWQLAGGHRDANATTVDQLWQGRLDALMDRIASGEFAPAMDLARAHVRLRNVDASSNGSQRRSTNAAA